MLDVWTYLKKIASDGSNKQKEYFPGVLQERTSGVMWMRTCVQMQKTFLYISPIQVYIVNMYMFCIALLEII